MTDQRRDYEAPPPRQAPTLSDRAPQGEHYLPPSHVQLLEKLEHLSRYSHFVQVVEGVPGSGKTILRQQFEPDPGDTSVHACSIQASEAMSDSELLSALVEQLTLDVALTASDETKERAVAEHAELLQDISRLFLIIIDDAEQLAESALDLLLNRLLAVSHTDARPHLVFFATPKLREMLNQPLFQPVMDSSCHFMELEALDEAAMAAYLRHRFPSIYPRLSEAQFKRLHNESFGLPGRVPRVLKAVIKGEKSVAEPPQTRPSPKTAPRKWLLGAGLVLLLAAGAGATWLLLPLGSQQAGDRLQVTLPVPMTEPSPITDTEPPTPALSLEEKLARAEAELAATAQAEPTPPADPVPASDDTAAPPEPTPASTDQLPAAPVRATPVASEPGEVSAAEPPTPKKRVLEIPQTPPLAAQPQDTTFGRENVLLSWNPDGYTLQILGARKEQSVTDFVQGHPQRADLYAFSTIFKGKPWYVVVYGEYRTRDQAMAAIPELPRTLRERRPWARSIKGVQNDIRRKE
ncbi:SPOR domain-containing protein [Motiliproteus sp. SC1-56]|uniref:SPOR domain-containing protein n=1 Tax=Motiliproteus sp. SC1-56 TaxID=2799565 RepID=UPI001A8E6B79|nr:AAA family ATPase [Motiliproteus sp. SC1-56]